MPVSLKYYENTRHSCIISEESKCASYPLVCLRDLAVPENMKFLDRKDRIIAASHFVKRERENVFEFKEKDQNFNGGKFRNLSASDNDVDGANPDFLGTDEEYWNDPFLKNKKLKFWGSCEKSNVNLVMSCQKNSPFEKCDDFTVVYCTGHCINKNKDAYIYGTRAGSGTYFGPNNLYNVSRPLKGRPTLTKAVLHGAIDAINQAKKAGLKKLLIRTTSSFVVKCMGELAPMWIWDLTKKAEPVFIDNNTRNSASGVLDNQLEFEEIYKVSLGMNIQWEYVTENSKHLGVREAVLLSIRGADEALDYY